MAADVAFANTVARFSGPNEIIKDEAGLNSIGVKYLKETDPQEPWIELWEHFLDEKMYQII
jgi:hypothetical protein